MTRMLMFISLLGLLLAACNGGATTVDAGSTPTVVPVPTPSNSVVPSESSEAKPSPSAVATASDQPGGGEAVAVQIFFLRDHDSGLWLVPSTVTVSGPGVAAAALTALTTTAAPDGVQRLTPDGLSIESVDVDPDGLLTVDLTRGSAGVGAAFEDALVQGIVLTATQFDTVDRVQILVDGQTAETLYGHVDISQPIEPDPFRIAPIVIADGMGIAGSGPGGGSIELSGTANVFEATFDMELLDAGGNIIESQFITATCGSGCRGDWTAAFTDLEPGSYTVLARESDPSDGEGRPVYDVTRTVVVP